jgi:hypothetical protein
MKIVLINRSDLNGGAAVFTYRLTNAFLKNNIEAAMLVTDKKSSSQHVVSYANRFKDGFHFLFERLQIFTQNQLNRKNLFKVDSSIIILGCFYIIVIAVYIFFESCIINYRPILINGILEASYPSSHTLMTICLMYAAVTECDILIKSKKTNKIIRLVSYLIIAITVIGRLISGVHWFTDIIGGILISSALIMFYSSVLYHFEHTINKFK